MITLILYVDDIIIQIEQEGENIEVVDEDDSGGPIVIIDIDEQNVIDADSNDPDKHSVVVKLFVAASFPEIIFSQCG